MKKACLIINGILIITLLLVSCGNKNYTKTTDIPEINQEGKANNTYLNKKADFSNSDFKSIIATTLNIPEDEMTYGDLKNIIGLDVYYYAERIENTTQYREICSVTVKKKGFNETFDLYYNTPEQERDGLEKPTDYSHNEQLAKFDGYKDIELLTELEELSLSSETKIVLSNPVPYFDSLKNLTSLSLYNYQVPGLEEIGELTKLTNLGIGINLRSIPDGVELEYIEDLTPLKKLTKLENLSLSGNIISDLSPLTSLKNLKELSVTNAALGDISPVAEMKGLENITLIYNGIEDVTPLTKIPNLKYINLDYNYIKDISPFAALNPDIVEYVSLDMNGIEDTTPLKHLGEEKVNFGYDPYWDNE